MKWSQGDRTPNPLLAAVSTNSFLMQPSTARRE
jgi:hypothetical protein